MNDLFLTVINMSISASWVTAAVLLLRLFLKKAPKWIRVLLWSAVGLRLVMPFSIESVFSLIPSVQTISKAPKAPRPYIESGITVVDTPVNDYLQSHYFEGVTRPADHFTDVMSVLGIIWLIGIAALLVYTAVSYCRLRRDVRTAVKLTDNVYQSENVFSPFVLGVFKPTIYLPFSITAQDMSHVIAHEQAHIKRKDHLIKPLGFLLLTLHWFNPLMWLSYILLCRDIELACDEHVIRNFDVTQKADYSEALLHCSMHRRRIAACPIAFGEVGVKARIAYVLHYKKPAFWVVVTAIVASIAVALCFLTNPKQESLFTVKRSGSTLDGVTLEIVTIDPASPDPTLTVAWKNRTLQPLLFGEAFTVYRDDNGSLENCSINKDPVWHTIGYPLAPLQTVTHTYRLNGQDMAQAGTYRFEASFHIDEQSETVYRAWVTFTLEKGIDGITVHTLKPVELVFSEGMYSFVQSVEQSPTYLLVNGMQLLEKRDGDLSVTLGTFERMTLNDRYFDSRFLSKSALCWFTDDRLQSLKKNNRRAWQLYADNDILYILLEQQDGTLYLGYGYYNVGIDHPQNPDDSHIRWLYRLVPFNAHVTAGFQTQPLSTLEELQNAYPEFFNLPTDGGLLVYVWQMSKDNYRCYLTNAAWDAVSDMSFAFESGTTIAQMRAILSTYDIRKEDIHIRAVINPLSSYAYIIDDDYREQLTTLFWNETPSI